MLISKSSVTVWSFNFSAFIWDVFWVPFIERILFQITAGFSVLVIVEVYSFQDFFLFSLIIYFAFALSIFRVIRSFNCLVFLNLLSALFLFFIAILHSSFHHGTGRFFPEKLLFFIVSRATWWIMFVKNCISSSMLSVSFFIK